MADPTESPSVGKNASPARDPGAERLGPRGSRLTGAILDTGASVLLVGAGSLLAATALFFIFQRDVYLAGFVRPALFVGVPSLLAFGAFATAPSRHRRPLAGVAVLLTVAVYGAELTLSYTNWLKWKQVLANSDPRSRIAILDELRAEGHDAWPVLSRISHTDTSQGHEPSRSLFSLGGIPDVLSVFCGEGRTSVTYRSDSFGFFNSESAFEPRPRIMIVGDSYMQGYCVGAEEGVAPRLRRRFPGTLNFAMSGMGPLAELATLREYGPLLKPEVVIWAFFAGNDWLDLDSEKQSASLTAYLDPDHRQELASRRDVIDRLLRLHVEQKRTEVSGGGPAKARGMWATLGPKVVPVLSLHNLLPFLGLPYGRVGFDYDLFETIVGMAKEEVASWSGELIFAYLPLTSDFIGWNRFASDQGIARQRTLAIVHEAGLRVVDLHPTIAALPDPMAVSSTPRAHYNAFGYELVAREVAAALDERMPSIPGESTGHDLAMKSRLAAQVESEVSIRKRGLDGFLVEVSVLKIDPQ